MGEILETSEKCVLIGLRQFFQKIGSIQLWKVPNDYHLLK